MLFLPRASAAGTDRICAYMKELCPPSRLCVRAEVVAVQLLFAWEKQGGGWEDGWGEGRGGGGNRLPHLVPWKAVNERTCTVPTDCAFCSCQTSTLGHSGQQQARSADMLTSDASNPNSSRSCSTRIMIRCARTELPQPPIGSSWVPW